MKTSLTVLLLPLTLCWVSSNGQTEFGSNLLRLEKVIELPGVSGRIDHLSFNSEKNVIYMAALGNNSIEVINLNSGKAESSITGLQHPQGVCYLPQTHAIAVANDDNGRLTFYDAQTLKARKDLDLGDDADNIRYISENKTVYVGYGNGNIALIDEATQKIRGTIALEGHPESFQVDHQTEKIWVNVPDANLIEVLDGNNLKVLAKWKQKNYTSNFPMAYDNLHQHLFVVFRHPSRLVVLNSETGAEVAALKCTGDADDIFYDAKTRRILLTGGAGFIDVFQEKGTTYTPLSHIASAPGARTSLWIPGRNELFVAAPKRIGHLAELRIYKMTTQ